MAPNRRCRFCPAIAIDRSCYCHACHGRVLTKRNQYENSEQAREYAQSHKCRACGHTARKDRDLCRPCEKRLNTQASKRKRSNKKRPAPQRRNNAPRQQPMPCYEGRNDIVKRLGFKAYGEYLKSPLWTSIRERVLWGNKPCCVEDCHRIANQVHHSKYTYDNLSGRATDFMHPVCKQCHNRAEVGANGHKYTLDEANERLGITKKPKFIRKHPHWKGPPRTAVKTRPITNESGINPGRSRETGSAPDLQLG